MDHLAYDETSFILAEVFALPEKHAQVEPVAVVHKHVNVGACLDGLVQFDGMRTVDQSVYPHFFLNALHVFVRNVGDVDDLTSVNRL